MYQPKGTSGAKPRGGGDRGGRGGRGGGRGGRGGRDGKEQSYSYKPKDQEEQEDDMFSKPQYQPKSSNAGIERSDNQPSRDAPKYKPKQTYEEKKAYVPDHEAPSRGGGP